MSVNRMAAVTASVLVAAVIAVGLMLGGSPAEQRRLRFDERRVDDLRVIARAVRVHWNRFGSLPGSLSILADGQNLDRVPVDPSSRQAYAYAVTGETGYRLCADFAKRSVNPPPQEFWVHGAGHHCFEFELGEGSGAERLKNPEV